MMWLLVGLVVMVGTGVLDGLLRIWGTKVDRLGAWGCVTGCGLALVSAMVVLCHGSTLVWRGAETLPAGTWHLELDLLSAFFVVPILVLSLLSAIYGRSYLSDQRTRADHWIWFNLLTVGMTLVVVARDGLLFVMAWELMTVASFFLVVTDDIKSEVRQAGWLYLAASHVGVACLLPMFLLLEHLTGDQGWVVGGLSAHTPAATVVLCLALIGFGIKAGIVPLHIWLPAAHPAAPSHVSAVMSGVMIKVGIYGIVRVCSLFHDPPVSWGLLLMGLGVVSGIYGVAQALAQHDLKRLLAYHSVENIGIICLGLGVGILGVSLDNSVLAVLGLAGGLLHVWNHAAFKGLLFLGAGAVQHATSRRQIDELGGLLRSMPKTGWAFLIGAAAICGLPPLNGFVSEFLIYGAAFYGLAASPGMAVLSLVLVAAALALIGGLAAACFAKVVGVVFLGQGRTAASRQAHEPSVGLWGPMVILAGICVMIGLVVPWQVTWLLTVVDQVMGGAMEIPVAIVTGLRAIGLGALVLIGLCLGLAVWRRRILAGRSVTTDETWGCGYTAPHPRMQYTGTSFAAPLLACLRFWVPVKEMLEIPRGWFPTHASVESHASDPFRGRLLRPGYRLICAVLERLTWIQHGHVHLYLLYMVVVLVVLLCWQSWGGAI